MDEIKKILKRIPKKDRILLKKAIIMILKGHVDSLQPKKLAGYSHIFRVRVGNYRIIYFWDGHHIFIKTIRKRDESTYKNI